MIRSIGILIMIAGAVQQSPPADSQRRQDVYSIYSVMMSNPPTSFDNEMLVIADTTRLAMQNPCIVPPPEYKNRWAEVLADFSARQNTPAPLERALKIEKPYVYIKLEEALAFTSPDQRYAGAKEAFMLSDVYFNKDRTLALTGVAARCGWMCYASRWKIYAKGSDGTWRGVRPEGDCYQVA